MSTVNLTAENIEETIRENEIVLLDFWASWCGPCKTFAPVFEAASEKHPDLVFGKVDTEANQKLAQDFGIMAIPTLVAIRDDIVVKYLTGALPPAQLEELIEEVRSLDMEEVRTLAA